MTDHHDIHDIHDSHDSHDSPTSVRAVRWVLGALGVVVGVYGAWLLWSREGSTAGLVNAVEWLVAGAVLHDAVLAPLTLVVVWLGRRVLPQRAQAPALVGLIVLGSATVFAIPVLGRFGARPDNPTLLDRHYVWGWVVLAVLVLVAVVVASWRRPVGGGVAPNATGRDADGSRS